MYYPLHIFRKLFPHFLELDQSVPKKLPFAMSICTDKNLSQNSDNLKLNPAVHPIVILFFSFQLIVCATSVAVIAMHVILTSEVMR